MLRCNTTFHIHRFAVQLRQFYLSCGASVQLRVLLGLGDGHWVLYVACFGAFFLLGFVPLGFVQARMVLYPNG